MAAGATRIVEIAIILKDQNCFENTDPLAFQYIPPFVGQSIINHLASYCLWNAIYGL